MDVVEVNYVLSHIDAIFIAFSVGDSRFDSGSGQSTGEDAVVVFPALAVGFVQERGPAEFRGPSTLRRNWEPSNPSSSFPSAATTPAATITPRFSPWPHPGAASPPGSRTSACPLDQIFRPPQVAFLRACA